MQITGNREHFCLEMLEGRLLLSADPTPVVCGPMPDSSAAATAELLDEVVSKESPGAFMAAADDTGRDIFQGILSPAEDPVSPAELGPNEPASPAPPPSTPVNAIGVLDWNEQGPGPIENGNNVILPAQNRPQVGAVHAIAV